jgi:hypothetical protein
MGVKYMWIKDIFRVEKPVIALLHLQALPGDPLYDREGNLKKVIDIANKELKDLQDGGVDGILFANEFSLPYQKKVSHVTTAAMGYIIGQLRKKIKVPFGVNVVLNPMASIELAAATGAHFVRSAFTGAYIGESGIINTDVAACVRRKIELGITSLKMFYKVNPESDIYIRERDIVKVTKSIIFHCFPDGLCVSGESAGSETDSEVIMSVKSVSKNIPVFCNTGCNAENIVSKLKTADGAFVGTYFKSDGKFDNNVDLQRVKEFMAKVQKFRDILS